MRHATVIPVGNHSGFASYFEKSKRYQDLAEANLNNAAIRNTVKTQNTFGSNIAAFGTGDLTVCGFCYIESGVNGGTTEDIQVIGGAANALLPMFRNAGAAEKYRLSLSIDGTYGSQSSNVYVEVGKWFHFAFVRNAGSVTYYYNGRAANAAFSQSLNASAVNSTQGKNSQYCRWARVAAYTSAMTANQVLEHFRSFGLSPNGLSPVWAMSDAGKYALGAAIGDKSGNSKTITLNASNTPINPL